MRQRQRISTLFAGINPDTLKKEKLLCMSPPGVLPTHTRLGPRQKISILFAGTNLDTLKKEKLLYVSSGCT